MVVKRICWRAKDGNTALATSDDGYFLATDLGIQRVPAWRARLFLAAQSLFQILMSIRPA